MKPAIASLAQDVNPCGDESLMNQVDTYNKGIVEAKAFLKNLRDFKKTSRENQPGKLLAMYDTLQNFVDFAGQSQLKLAPSLWLFYLKALFLHSARKNPDSWYQPTKVIVENGLGTAFLELPAEMEDAAKAHLDTITAEAWLRSLLLGHVTESLRDTQQEDVPDACAAWALDSESVISLLSNWLPDPYCRTEKFNELLEDVRAVAIYLAVGSASGDDCASTTIKKAHERMQSVRLNAFADFLKTDVGAGQAIAQAIVKRLQTSEEEDAAEAALDSAVSILWTEFVPTEHVIVDEQRACGEQRTVGISQAKTLYDGQESATIGILEESLVEFQHFLSSMSSRRLGEFGETMTNWTKRFATIVGLVDKYMFLLVMLTVEASASGIGQSINFFRGSEARGHSARRSVSPAKRI